MKALLEFFTKLLELVLQWPERKRQKEEEGRKRAKNNWEKIRNAYELSKDKRSRPSLDLLKLRDTPKRAKPKD